MSVAHVRNRSKTLIGVLFVEKRIEMVHFVAVRPTEFEYPDLSLFVREQSSACSRLSI